MNEVPCSESLKPPRERLVSWLARLYRHRLTTTTGGNLSFIDDDGTLYITPSGGDKAIVPPASVCVCKAGHDSFEGPLGPSMEWQLHTEVYKARPDCKAVLHSHSMALIAFSLAEDKGSISSRLFDSSSDTGENHNGVPDTRCLLSAWLSCGRVSFVPYYPPGSKELAVACAEALSRGECAVLQNHGVVTIGATLQEAFNRFVTLEHLARSIINATQLGVPIPLKENVLDIRRDGSTNRGYYLLPIKRCQRDQCCCSRRKIAGIEKETRKELCTLVKRAYDQQLFTASSGAFSIRITNSEKINGTTTCRSGSANTSFLVSPTHIDRSSLSLDTICYLSDQVDCARNDCMICNGRNESTTACYFHPTCTHKSNLQALNMINPSHSAEIHHTIYKNHPEVNCIIIAQPKYASAFCITGSPFNSAQIPESYLVLGNVKTLPFESLQNAGIAISNALNPSDGITTVIISGFGLLSVGTSPLKTFVQVEVCESMCGVLVTARRRGGVVHLNSNQLNELDDLFSNKH